MLTSAPELFPISLRFLSLWPDIATMIVAMRLQNNQVPVLRGFERMLTVNPASATHNGTLDEGKVTPAAFCGPNVAVGH